MKNPTTLYRGRYLSLMERDGWEYASRSNATGVAVLVAVTDRDELVLVEQFRTPVNAHVIELPAGLVGDLDDHSESVLDAAQRELMEETGYRAGHVEILMSCPSSAGMSDEIITFILARNLEKVGPGGGDNSEDIAVHLVPRAEVSKWIAARQREGKPADPKIFSALYWLAESAKSQETTQHS